MSTRCHMRLCKQRVVGAELECAETTQDLPGGSATCSVPHADNYTLIEVRTSALNSQGSSNASLPLTCVTLPGEPLLCHREDTSPPKLALSVGSVGQDTLELAWKASRSTVLKSVEIQRDDWWTDKPLGTVGIANGTSYSITGLLPATTYHLRARGAFDVSGTIVMSEWSDLATATTHTSGACGDSHNLPLQKSHFNDLKSKVQYCLITALGNADKAAACITKDVGFTDACARCWVTEGKCAASQCTMCITAPAGKQCEDCCIQKCFPPLIECTGLPMYTDPM